MPPKKKAKAETSQGKRQPSHSDSEEEMGEKKRKTKSRTQNGTKVVNQTKTDFHSQDFSNISVSRDGNSWNLKIVTWNVDGIRAWAKKGGSKYVLHEVPDIFCLQETKCSVEKLPPEIKHINGYHSYWSQGENDGYAGVGLYSKELPSDVTYGIGIPEFDRDGRLITAEYEKFFLVNVYVPNAGRGLVTLPKRMEWDPEFRKYLKSLDARKPVILCGDLNVAHNEIDIANPKSNKRNAGFTQEERDGFSKLLSEGFIDTFRHKYPEVKGAYTFWTYMANARKKNVGWRLDYCIISERLVSQLCDCVIRKDVFGSDHCPLALFMHM